MRLKIITAPTMNEAMRQLKNSFGDEAIIVSTAKGPDGTGVSITIAMDREEKEIFTPPVELPLLDRMQESAGNDDLDRRKTINNPAKTRRMDIISESLDRHGLPDELSSQLIRAAAFAQVKTPMMSLAVALDNVFHFSPLIDQQGNRPIILIGPPGTGKTVTVAKLAARIMLAGHQTHVISTDTVRAGGLDQLTTYTDKLRLQLGRADSPKQLEKALQGQPASSQIFIDSLGTNPFRRNEMQALSELIEQSDAEPVLVMAAGGDLVDTDFIAAAFCEIGAQRMIVTRLDMTRRLGSILWAAYQNSLSFCDVSTKPEIIEGIHPINPVSLSRLLLPDMQKPAGREAIG